MTKRDKEKIIKIAVGAIIDIVKVIIMGRIIRRLDA